MSSLNNLHIFFEIKKNNKMHMHMHIKNMHILDISSLNNLHVFFSDETKDRPGDQKSKKNNDGWLETGRNEDEAEANADQDVWPV